MANPNPLLLLLLWLLYSNYRKKFLKKPENFGKKPKGCLAWYFGFILKMFVLFLIISVIAFIISLIIYAISGITP